MDFSEIPPDGAITLFSIFRTPFPSERNAKIPTGEFIDASNGVVILIDKLGKVFAPVKYDMNGNITKLTKKYKQDETKYKFLEDMILHEREEGLTNVSIDALQWLRRGLHFLQRYFECILEDSDKRENHTGFLKRAYEDTLQRYHGWMGTQLFGIMNKFAPSRKDLFFILSYDTTGKDEIVERDMKSFVDCLSICVTNLICFYVENGLETYARV